jgi:KDO2-lipid IV(A) lauroyltransferase
MADAFARAWIGRNDRTERVVRRNLELAYPELLPAQRESLVAR